MLHNRPERPTNVTLVTTAVARHTMAATDQRESKFHEEVSNAFTNYGADKRGFILSTELDVPLRQLSLPIDIKLVQDLLASQQVAAYDISAFLELVHMIIALLQGIADRRERLQNDICTEGALAVMDSHRQLLDTLFVQYAPERAGTERAMSTENLIDMARELCLVPQRLSEESVRTSLHELGLEWIPLDIFPEVMMRLAHLFGGQGPTSTPPLRLHALLEAIGRFIADPTAERARVEAGSHAIDPGAAEAKAALSHARTDALVAVVDAAHAKATAERAAANATQMAATQLSVAPPPVRPASAPRSQAGPRSGHSSHARSPRSTAVAPSTAPPKRASRVHSRDSVAGCAPAASSSPRLLPPASRAPAASVAMADATVGAEVVALREHVATLEFNLVHAEKKLREAGVLATRVEKRVSPRAADPRAAPSYRFREQADLTTDSEHEQTMEQFAKMRQTVASLAARNSALEFTKGREASAEADAAKRESVYTARERALRKEVETLRGRNRDLELAMLVATKAATEEKAARHKQRRDDEKSAGEMLLASDGRGVRFAAGTSGDEAGDGERRANGTILSTPTHEAMTALRRQLGAAQRENAALRAQVESLEEMAQKKICGAGGGADGTTLLEYAASMRMRPLGSNPASALNGRGGGALVAANGGLGGGTRAGGRAAASTSAPVLTALHHEWVDSVLAFSSERDDDGYAARQLVGPPRVYPMHGHAMGAWQPKRRAGGEFVEVRFAHPMYISEIEIYETYAAGGVTSISLWRGESEGGGWDTVWTGDATSANEPREARRFVPPISQRAYATQHARLEMSASASTPTDAPAAAASTTDVAAQIDAIRAVGMRAPKEAAAADSPRHATTTTTTTTKPTGGGSPPSSPFKAAGGADAAFHVPGSAQAAMTAGPRYRQVEAELRSLKEGHAREMRQLRAYVDQLRSYGERMRTELDQTKAQLEAHREELRARPPREQ